MRASYLLFSETVQYWSIQWEAFIVFFFRESSILIYKIGTIYRLLFRESLILIYTMRTIYRLLFQREFNNDLYKRTIYRLLLQREFNTDLYNENHLSSSFSKRVQCSSIQWEPFVVFFFRESSILIYTMITIYHLLFQREFNAHLYNENHLLSSFSERVQYWSIQW